MKKTLLFLVCAFCAFSGSALTYNVTVPAGTQNCYIVGEMNGWDIDNPIEMVKVDDTHFTYELETLTDEDLAIAKAYEYKYCNGKKWDYVEVNGWGGAVDNRTYHENDVVYWNNVEAGGVAYFVGVPAGTYACFIAGEMNGWSFQKMDKVDSFNYYLYIPTASNKQEYKYSCGDKWNYAENGDNRNKLDNHVNDNVSGWASVYMPDVAGDITFTVTVPAGTPACYLVGDFNGWTAKDEAYKMQMVNETTYTYTMTGVTNLQYKYHCGYSWENYNNNRIATAFYDSEIHDNVGSWQDGIPSAVESVATNGLKVYGTAGNIAIAADVAGELNVYNAQGMLVTTVRYDAGTTTVALPRGIYLANHTKVLVY